KASRPRRARRKRLRLFMNDSPQVRSADCKRTRALSGGRKQAGVAFLRPRPGGTVASGDAARGRCSALARLETRVGLADHEDLATATNDLAVAVTGLRRLQGGQDLHDCLWYWDGVNKPPSIAVPDRKSVV